MRNPTPSLQRPRNPPRRRKTLRPSPRSPQIPAPASNRLSPDPQQPGSRRTRATWLRQLAAKTGTGTSGIAFGRPIGVTGQEPASSLAVHGQTGGSTPLASARLQLSGASGSAVPAALGLAGPAAAAVDVAATSSGADKPTSPGSRAGALASNLAAAIAGRGAAIARGPASRLASAWLTALVALLAATAALWPLWRDGPSEDEPELCVAPLGSEVAAAAGR